MARTRSRTTTTTQTARGQTALERRAPDAPGPGLSLGAKLGIGAGAAFLLAGAAFLLWPSGAEAAATSASPGASGAPQVTGSAIVAEVQSGLVKARIVAKGRTFGSIDVNGVPNDVTEQAIRAYQARYGLADTGQVSAALRQDMVARGFIRAATPAPSPSR